MKKRGGITSKNFWLSIDAVLTIVSIVLTLFLFQIVFSNNANVSNKIKVAVTKNDNRTHECDGCVERLIDGVMVQPGLENLFPYGIMIENHTDARPQANLSKANVVFEAETEGGITRFLAIFANDNEIEKIGPVRSARPYFVDWAKEYSALYAHVGGSPAALAKIAKENILDINEFYNEHYFWRDKVREAPHNVYTSSAKLKTYLDQRELSEGQFIPWVFKDDKKTEVVSTSSISIAFERDAYNVEWKYQKETNDYLRFQNYEMHLCEDNKKITAKNILIAKMDQKILDSKLRISINHIGEGGALICMDGHCRNGKWKKNSSSARTRFYDMENNEIKLNRGKTWVEIAKPSININF